MRQTVRNCTFETNSSSTHSLSILSEDNFKKFEEGQLYIDWNDNLLTREEVEKKLYTESYTYEKAKQDFFDEEGFDEDDFDSEDALKEEVFNYVLKMDGSIYNYYSMLGDGQERYETFERHYTTDSGDKIVAFGYYGNDW